VEIEVQGDPPAVEALVAWARVGPPLAIVDDVDAERVQTRPTDAPFVVR
jgi:acylphosphatase